MRGLMKEPRVFFTEASIPDKALFMRCMTGGVIISSAVLQVNPGSNFSSRTASARYSGNAVIKPSQALGSVGLTGIRKVYVESM